MDPFSSPGISSPLHAVPRSFAALLWKRKLDALGFTAGPLRDPARHQIGSVLLFHNGVAEKL